MPSSVKTRTVTKVLEIITNRLLWKNEYKNTIEDYYDSNKHLNFQYADTTVRQQASRVFRDPIMNKTRQNRAKQSV